MYEIECTIEGLVPAMFDRFFNPEETETAKTKSKKTWKDDLPKKMYMDKKGVYVPADNVRMMLIGNQKRRGAAKILGSDIESGKGTKYLSFCEGCIWVLGTPDPLKVYVEPKRATYDDYDERSFINTAGSRSLTRRPIITVPWRLSFIVQVTDNQFDSSKIKELFEVAGLRCGVGAYGPTFGRFVITRWQVLTKKKQAS